MEYEFYIVNECDKPYRKHICQKMDDDGHLEYISNELRNWHRKNGQMQINNESIKIESFGFDVTIKDGYAHFEKVRQSVAKYHDGSHRAWQGEHVFTLKIKGMK